MEEETIHSFSNYEESKKRINFICRDINEERTAEQDLFKLRQLGYGASYTAAFQRLAAKTDWGVKFLNAEDKTAESEDKYFEKLEDGESETPESAETKGRTGSWECRLRRISMWKAPMHFSAEIIEHQQILTENVSLRTRLTKDGGYVTPDNGYIAGT